MQSATTSVLILPTSSSIKQQQNATSSNDLTTTTIEQSNQIKSVILLPSLTSPINTTSTKSTTTSTASTVKKQQPIKPKLKPSDHPTTQNLQIKKEPTSSPIVKQLKIVPKILSESDKTTTSVLTSKLNQEFKKFKSKKRSSTTSDSTNTNEDTSKSNSNNKNNKRSFKRLKRDLASTSLSSLDPEITNLIKSISKTNNCNNSNSSNSFQQISSSSNYKESLAFFSSSRTSTTFRTNRFNTQSISPKTAFSSSLFDSIEYLSSSWTNIFKTGNDTDQESLNLFRQFHCADCLKSFQQQKQPLKLQEQQQQKEQQTDKTNLNKSTSDILRSTMNTPPPPLQPIADEAKNGLYHYFGQQQQQQQTQQNNQQQPQQLQRSNLASSQSPFLSSLYTSSPYNQLTQQQQQQQNPNSVLSNQNMCMHEIDESDLNDDEDDRSSQISIQEKRQSLSRKLAQRRPKQELIERGILPPSRVSNLYYNRMKHLEKAQLQDILRTKIEKRPNRELLVQKNILPDSAPKAAPSLQLKCNELKRARLADDLNEKLAKRPGPLELVESGILVSSDSTLTEAIKDGKLVYPRTNQLINSIKPTPYHQDLNETPTGTNQDDLFNLDDSSLNYLNFNFNNLDENDDSNASQTSTSTAKTNNTLASISSSAASFNNNNNNSNNLTNLNQLQQQQQHHQQQQNNEIINFNDFQFQSSNAPSPSSSTASTVLLNKSSPNSSPYHNYEFLSNQQQQQPQQQKSKTLIIKQKTVKSFSSASSTTSSTSSSSKTGIKIQRNNSNMSASSNSSTTQTGSNTNQNGTKKLSQLIFHEYRGPNQKSSKTSISLKPKTNPNNLTNQTSLNNNNNNNSNAPTPVSQMNSLTQQGQTNTSEIFFDDSNDSANTNLNSAMMIDHYDEMNPHKIRMKQQKIFLKYNSSNHNLREEWTEHDTKMTELNSVTTSGDIMNTDVNKDKLIAKSPQSAQTSNNQSNQSIQLLPIGDIQMLMNNGNFMPIRTISVDSFNNSNTNNNNNNNNNNTSILPPSLPAPVTNKLVNNLSTSNLYPLDTNSSITPLLLAQPTMSQSLQSLPLMNQFQQQQQASPSIKSATSEILPPPSNKQIKSDTAKLVNLDEMSLNELKDECRRRKLLVTGNKQKLIERIRSSFNGNANSGGTTTAMLSTQLSGIKSPDSGVNMDSSPSFISSEQSPCGSGTNTGGGGVVVVNPKQKANLLNEQHSSKLNHLQQQQRSSLDDFFNYLDIENLGANSHDNNNIGQSTKNDVNKSVHSNTNDLLKSSDKDTAQKSQQQQQQQPDNITETAATLEMTLKNSAELLKQLSSTGQIEHLHLLEMKMKESMEFIERLKSASSNAPSPSPQPLTQLNSKQTQPFEQHNKLRIVNSMPSNLRELELLHQHHNNHQQVIQQQQQHHLITQHNHYGHNFQTTYDIPMQINDSKESQNKLNIPSNKNTYDMNSKYQQQQFNDHSNQQSSVKDETVYQFDTLMKELTNERVTFTCNPADDEDNSNETDQIILNSNKHNKQLQQNQFNSSMYHTSSLTSIDSIIGQNHQQQRDNNINHLNHHENHVVDNQTTTNVEMDWNETELLELCKNLDDTEHLFDNNTGGNNHINSSNSKNSFANHHHHTNQTSSYMIHQASNYDLNQHRLDCNSSTSNNANNLILNEPIGAIINNNNKQQTNDPLMLKSNLYIDNSNANSTNTNNANMIQWDFDNDLNQIASYLQSPTA